MADLLNDPSYVVTLETVQEKAEPLLELARTEWGMEPAQFITRGQDRTWLELYFEEEVNALLAARVLEGNENVRGVSVRSTHPRDWQKMFRRHFSVREIGERLRVVPIWEREDFEGRDDRLNILINPGLSFGTGEHFTTLFCLEMLDRIWSEDAPASLLDIGTGSGILSIAAARLGCKQIMATENADYVLRCATENLALNGVAEQVELSLSDIEEDQVPGTFDVVCANLYGNLLIDCAPRISRASRRWVALSGIRETEADAVANAFIQQGCREVVRDGDGEWAGLLFRVDLKG